ncbi:hypothetical protein VHUM_03977 [Vanrija humicola]|uniref:Deacetylase sirtuin-type domain-containing protein n=1 Tax=Vanrija humicola TaxID=5417 RepID=A0A7D8UW34_VANHU|nr:hypothetical protein VHUM_03977 [Vanrija humicola]
MSEQDGTQQHDTQHDTQHPPELAPTETYQVDSEEFDSGSDAESLGDDEYEALVHEAETGYTDVEADAFVTELKEQGLVNFLRSYLSPQAASRSCLPTCSWRQPRSLREPGIPDIALLGFAKVALSRVLRRRQKLPDVNSVDDAVRLLQNAKNIIVLSGAGISTSCGIPDFRSSTGLYAQLQAEGKYELDDPQQMFDISYFREHPEVFYSFAKQIYPSNFVPSPCHRWIKLLEDRGVLLRNYTQNIDTLESLAGVNNVLQCHGSFKTASCLRCKTRHDGSKIEPYIMSQTIPYCETCREERNAEIAAIKAYRASVKGKGKGKASAWDDDSDDEEEIDEWGRGEPGIIKPDITFFGQALDSEFDECLFKDREDVDLLVIMGTSLKVAPVSEVLSHIPHSVPQIFINLTPVTHVKPDVLLLGDADSIVTNLSDRLGWTIPPPPSAPPLKVPLDDAVWVSGDGNWSHLHMLRSRTQLEEEDETEDDDSVAIRGGGLDGVSGAAVVAAPDDDSDDDDGDETSESETKELQSSDPDKGRRSGTQSPGSDRPAKRSRVGSVSDDVGQ